MFNYRKILNLVSEGFVLQDSNGVIIEFNQSALKILGLTEDQLKGKTSTDPHWKCVDRY